EAELTLLLQHTGHIGASSYASATSMAAADPEALKSQLAEVAAALRFDDIGMALASSSAPATPSAAGGHSTS
ncbi:hypothetical protein ABXW19_12285, partial [Streptococcus suis]